ncbi:TetR/AcrR family transcriptional regulator [Mycobacterium sp. MMS18-G62]
MSTTTPQLGRPVGASGEETRQRIMSATMKCVAEVGYSRATIREIARQADMTSGSLYHYFPNKAELVTTTMAEFAQIAIPRLQQAGQRGGNFRDRLVSLLDSVDALMNDYPHCAAYERAIRVESAQHLHLAAIADTGFNALRDIITNNIEQAHREGALAPGIHVDGASSALYAMMRGLSEHGATASAAEYHATLEAMKLLIRGTLFRGNPR